MITIFGKYTNAIAYSDTLDEATINQIKLLCDQDYYSDTMIRIMPDAHSGKGCVIGFTAKSEGFVVPNLIGVDIGCGMLLVPLGKLDIDFAEFDNIVRSKIPLGFNHHAKEVESFEWLDSLACLDKLQGVENFNKSIGTLGGGNHFIEIDIDDEGNKYLVIHSGSRNLGNQVAKYYQELAVLETGRKYPADLCSISGKAYKDYLDDVLFCHQYAWQNRNAIADIILKSCNIYLPLNHQRYHVVHNYIDDYNMIRKGAVSARSGEFVYIPINMRDGGFICTGLGNKDWNYSAPHGAGRLMSRAFVNKHLDVEYFKKTMGNVFSTSVDESTLDESPDAYKPMDEIRNAITETVRIEKVIKPIYNLKDSKKSSKIVSRN